YTPPSSAEMSRRQDEDEALRLLIAQRRLHRRAKRWLGLRWVGMAFIGTAAPIVSVVRPDLAVVAGAVAGVWIFLGRTLFIFAQSSTVTKAAAIQEQFDFFVYGMPGNIDRSALPSLEEIAEIAGPDSELRDTARREQLFAWYPIDESDSGSVTVAISQRANASYAYRLLKVTAVVWASLTLLWSIVLIVFSVLVELSLLQFIAGVFLPILPAVLDIVQYVFGIWQAARDRRDLADSIQERLEGAGGVVDGQDLVAWQEHLYGLRQSTTQAPDFVYKIRRKANELAMHSAARQLGDKAKRQGHDSDD
ncbi:MAG: S-4TM family putative pore-forming effector, partial [Rubrobacter sp.]|nr:S-4TM family putative pore-forming effector [Rubrobacter sp.]